MAAPQDTLTNDPCSLAVSPTVLAATYRTSSVSAESFGSGHPSSCGDVYGGVSVRSVGVPCGAHYPSPRPASRRARPCSLCGTAALRPHTAVVPPSSCEQPVVLLHRLEDGLPQGDVNSLRAYGTIRLLPVHSPSALEDDASDHDGDSDGDHDGEVKHAMAQSVEAGEGGKDEDKRIITEYTTWCYSNGGDDNRLLSEANHDHSVSEKSVGSKIVRTESNSEVINSVNMIENNVEKSDSHFLGIRIHSVVLGKDLGTEFHGEEGNVGVRDQCLVSRGSTVVSAQPNAISTSASSVICSSSLPCQPSCSASCPTYQPLTGAVLPLSLSPSAVSHFSCHTTDLVPSDTQFSSHSTLSASHTSPSVTYTTLSTKEHSSPAKQLSATTHSSPTITEPYPTATNHAILATTCPQSSRQSYPYTPVSTVFSSNVLPLPSSSLPQSHPSASLTSHPTLSHLNSPPSPPSSSPSPTLPSGSGHELSYLASSADTQLLPPSSPYSPRTLPSSPGSPASLPSRVESPPSPTPSCESPPPSPDLISGLPHDEAGRLSPHMLIEIPEQDAGTSTLTTQVGILPSSQDEQSDKRLTKGCQDDLSLESEIKPLPESKSDLTKNISSGLSAHAHVESLMDAQVELSILSQVNPSGAIQVESPKDTQTEALLEEVKTHVEPSEGTHVVPFLDSKESKVDNEEFIGESAKGLADYCESVRDQTDSIKGPMRMKFRLRHKLDMPPLLGIERKKCNKDSGIPKIILTLKGNGPNKEYSCSNRLRGEGQSFSRANVNRKHKSKKYKRQRLRYKEKIKKGLKGNKHKRHLELFGENSNDSCDISGKSNGTVGQNGKRAEATVEGQKGLPLPVAFPTLGESPKHNEDLSLTPAEKESSAFSVKVKKICENIKYSSASDSVDDSSSDSLPDLEPLAASKDDIPRSEDIELPVAEEVQDSKYKVDSVIVKDRLQDGSPPISLEVLPVVDSTGLEKTSQENRTTVPSTNATIGTLSPLPHPEELTGQREPDHRINTRGCTLRSRRNRLVNNSESDRDSDTCLWVSFGVDGPVPLPASDVPSLEPVPLPASDVPSLVPILSSSGETYKSGDSDHDIDCSPSGDDNRSNEETNQAATVRKQGIGEKHSEVLSEMINSVDRLVEERAELLVKEYNERQKRLSSGCWKLQSFDDDGKDWTTIKKNKKVKRKHRRSSPYKVKEFGNKVRESSKRVSSSSVSWEVGQHNDASLSKDISPENVIQQSNARQEYIASTLCDGASNDQKTDSLAPDPLDLSETDRRELQNCFKVVKPPVSHTTSVIISASSENNHSLIITEEQASNLADPPETTESANRLGSLNTGEAEDQYYRPKKIRRISDLKLSMDQLSETDPSVDHQDSKRSWSVISETEKNQFYEKNLSVDEIHICTKTVLTPNAIIPVTSTEPSGGESCCATSQVEMLEGSSQRDRQIETFPQDPESEKEQKRRKSRPRESWRKDSKVGSQDGSSVLTTDGRKIESSDKSDKMLLKEDRLSAKENAQQDTPNKEGKEKKRRSRKDRKKDELDLDSDSRNEGNVNKTSALQEAQLRLEVLHDEERGRRLAQEIKGFNWLEQKIKNGSLLSSGSSPPTPTPREPGLVSKSSTTSSLVSFNPQTPSSTAPFSFTAKKEERDCRKSSPSGSSGVTGLRGHLQTAVPPLVPSSRVTALPKRRLSPTHLPALTHSTSAALYSSTNGSSMTVQGTINSTVPTLHGTSHGKTGTNCGKPCVAAAYNTIDSNKATLYSSTTCNKATVYGVNSDSLEVLYDNVATSANYYVRTKSNNASFYDGTTTVPSKFCGSTKNLASIHHSHVQSSAAVTCPSVITSTAIAPTVSGDWPPQMKGHIRPPDFSYSDSSASVSSDLAIVQHSCSINSQSASTTVPPTPQRFSHKHTLLRRAFSEMLKTDSESTAEKGMSLFKFDKAAELPKKQDVSKLEEALAAFTPLLTTSASRSEKSPGSSQAATEVIEMFDCSALLVDHKKASCKMNSEEPPETVKKEEIQAADDKNNELQSIKTKEIQKVPETIQKILECITDAGGETVQFFRSETKSDKGEEDDKEMQSSLLLSLLYKELITTKQEVEKLRKMQELMLTEKEEKKEDNSEESKGGDIIIFSEEKCAKRKCAKESDSLEPQLDSKEFSHPETKKSKISIRNDLLSTDTNNMLTTPPATSDISCLPRNGSPPARTSPSVLKTNPQISSSAKVPLASPALSESSSELSVISLVSSAVSQTSHVSSRTSPGVSGMSRTSPGLSRTSPGLPRTSPGLPKTSPGLLKTSPGLPRTSPGLSRTSPGLPRTSPGLPKMSPGAPRTSPATPQSDVIVPHSSPPVSQNTQTCPPAILPSPTPLPTHNTVMPRITSAQSDSISGTRRSRHGTSYGSTTIPQSSPTSRTCSVIPKTNPVISHAMSRTSPAIPRTNSASSSIPISEPEAQLTGMNLNKLRTVFGISNSEVEVMPVSLGGKFPLSEPQPQTYLKLVEDQQQQQPQEMSIMLNTVKGIRRSRSTKDIEILPSHGPSPFHCPQASYEGTRRTLHSQFYEGEIKHSAFSTSDLPDFPPSVRKQPPPLKPAASLVRRHSDSLDVRPVDPMIHRLIHPSTLTAPAVSVHSTNSSPMEQHNTSLYSFTQPQCSPTQYPSNAQTMRRNSESSCTERSREYQQVVAMSMKQHPYPQHLGSNAPMMRSLGPDKATIFPIPARMSTVIRPFKPPTPPTSTRAMLEQYQNENFYQSNFSFFERLRENIQQGCETGSGADRGGHATQERLQPPIGNIEKPLQPQTFAPRVLVRESIPETPHMPPPSFSAPNYANTNQHLSTVLPSHHGHFPNNMHPSTTIHHIASVGLHPGNHQSVSSVMTNTNNTLHRNTSGSGNGEKRQCLSCPQSARFVCSGCKKAWYCSEQCQRGHWTLHNSACVP